MTTVLSLNKKYSIGGMILKKHEKVFEQFKNETLLVLEQLGDKLQVSLDEDLVSVANEEYFIYQLMFMVPEKRLNKNIKLFETLLSKFSGYEPNQLHLVLSTEEGELLRAA